MTKMTTPELYRQLRAMGFSAEQAIAEINGTGAFPTRADHSATEYADDEPAETFAQSFERRRTVRVPVKANGSTRRVVNRGPRVEYAVRPLRKGQKVTVSMGNNTDVYKYLTSLRGRKATVPMIAKATGIMPHSVESSVYRLVTDGLLSKHAIESR